MNEQTINVDNIEIPVKALHNHELDYYADKLGLRSFRGVFMRDALPRPINTTESAVVNLDDSDGPGTHWVAYWNNPKDSIYFDSCGLDPPSELYEYLCKLLRYSTNEIQERNSVICGHLCLYLLKEPIKGKQFKEIIFSLL